MKKFLLISLIILCANLAKTQPYSVTILKDIRVNSTTWDASSSPSAFVKAGDYVYFKAADLGMFGVSHIWKTDGTETGTTQAMGDNIPLYILGITAIPYGNQIVGLNNTDMVSINGNVGEETKIMTNITSTYTAPISTAHSFQINNKLYFWAGTSTNSYGIELYGTDGTLSGTSILKDINPAGDGFPATDVMNISIVVGSEAFFIAKSNDSLGLYKTDGTENGTELIKNLSKASYYYIYPKLINGNIMITNTTDCWSYNTNTEVIRHILKGAFSTSKIWDVNDKLVFVYYDGIDYDLIASDGQSENTMLTDSKGFLSTSYYTTQKSANNKLFISKSENVLYNPIEVWKTDGNTIEKVVDNIYISNLNTWYASGNKILWYNDAHTDVTKSYRLYEINTETYTVTEAFNFTALPGASAPFFDQVKGRFYFNWTDANGVAYNEPHYIDLGTANGIFDPISLNKFEIYPNPTNSVLNFNIEYENGTIYDYSGRIVLEFNNKQQINIEQLKSGLFFITLETQKGKIYNKFIKN
jgi:ELWxxDGT repeat protein